MIELPMLFSAPMVRGLLNDTKTQTRRMFKAKNGGVWPNRNDLPGMRQILRNCPYGQRGDRLWVRETFQYRGASYDGRDIDDAEWFRCYGQGGASDSWDPIYPDSWEPSRHMGVRKMTEPSEQEGGGITGWLTKRIPGIHMPRWASRITLEINSVRVERLQDISEADAIAEGIEPFTDFKSTGHWLRYCDGGMNSYVDNPITSYASLWTEINGPGSWDANPWVWVIQFKRLDQQAISEGRTK